jgi:hypothetical protein
MQAQIEQLNYKWQVTEQYLRGVPTTKQPIKVQDLKTAQPKDLKMVSLTTESAPSMHIESTQRDTTSKMDNKSSHKKSSPRMVAARLSHTTNPFHSLQTMSHEKPLPPFSPMTLENFYGTNNPNNHTMFTLPVANLATI